MLNVKGKTGSRSVISPFVARSTVTKKKQMCWFQIEIGTWHFYPKPLTIYPQPPPPLPPSRHVEQPLAQDQLENCDKLANKILNPSDANF